MIRFKSYETGEVLFDVQLAGQESARVPRRHDAVSWNGEVFVAVDVNWSYESDAHAAASASRVTVTLQRTYTPVEPKKT